MKERGRLYKIDRYLRSENTAVSRLVNRISLPKGEKYLKSKIKRATELAICAPASVAAAPAISVLAAASYLEDREGPFYIDQRIGKSGKFIPVIKIRTMKFGSDKDPDTNIANGQKYKAEDDPRNTKLGRIFRKFNLDELPQIFQVVLGDLSLIGVRASPKYVFDYIKKIYSEKNIKNGVVHILAESLD